MRTGHIPPSHPGPRNARLEAGYPGANTRNDDHGRRHQYRYHDAYAHASIRACTRRVVHDRLSAWPANAWYAMPSSPIAIS